MTKNADQFRSAIIRCAANAAKEEPTDPDRRARIFIARLSGSMDLLDEPELDRILCALINMTPAAVAAQDITP